MAIDVGFLLAMFMGAKPSMPNVGEQLLAAFGAPLPFVFALLAIIVPIGVLIWKAMEWGYGRVIDAKQSIIDQKADQAELLTRELDETRAKLAKVEKRAEAMAQNDPKNELALYVAGELKTVDAQLASASSTATSISSDLTPGAMTRFVFGRGMNPGSIERGITPHSNK